MAHGKMGHLAGKCGHQLNRRDFLMLAVGTACVTPLAFGSSAKICDCGSHMRPLVNDRCANCASADEMNYFLFTKGLRPTP